MGNFCSNILCLYHNNGKCLLKNISVDEIGVCKDMILVTLSKEVENLIKNETKKALKNLEK